MTLPRLFIKAATPIASVFLILVGILQLRAQFWTVGAICIILAMLGFILSMRMLERTPFTTEEIDTLRPWAVPAIGWTVVASLLLVSVFYVADNFKSPQTDRIAAIGWVTSVILGLMMVWGKPSWYPAMIGCPLRRRETSAKFPEPAGGGHGLAQANSRIFPSRSSGVLRPSSRRPAAMLHSTSVGRR